MYVNCPCNWLATADNLLESLMPSQYERSKGLIPKTRAAKFDWSTSVAALALLGSRWKIAPELLFPVTGRPLNDFCPDDINTDPKLLGGGQNMDWLESLELPSKRRTTSTVFTNDSQTVTETLFFAATFTPPRLDGDFVNTLRSHYAKPDYYFLRVIRISQMIGSDQVVEKYIVVCDLQTVRGALKNRFISRSSFDDRSLMEPEAISRGHSPISLVRSSKRHVIDQLCYNLDCLKINLEEAVSSPGQMRKSTF